MEFKKGMSWKACHDEKKNLYTAETWSMGSGDLYEIDASIYNRLTKGIKDSEATSLISEGRHLYMSVNDRCGPPYTVVFDDDYMEICPWFGKKDVGKKWSEEMTDAAVEIFESEKKNREQRRKKRAERSEK